MVAVGGDVAEGSGIEVCSGDHSTRSAEKNFTFIFGFSGWALMTPSCLKTRKCCFQTIWSHRSLALSTEAKGQWHTFGYVVTELLEEVHGAIVQHEVIKTTFKTIKCMFTCTRCDHGFYAAVNITRKGLWSSQVIKHANIISHEIISVLTFT